MNICLCMIVRNEEKVICRCLESVKPWVTSWLIVDTGSQDQTRDIIRQTLGDLPGDVHDRPWIDFATNRNQAMDLARAQGSDYLLMIDADEVFEAVPGARWPELTADGYTFPIALGDLRYARTQLVRSDRPWRYVGVLHEALVCDGADTRPLSGLLINSLGDGHRNEHPKAKYRSDIKVLREAWESDPCNSRIAFYLAQSYQCAGELPQAMKAYERRVSMGGWAEECYYSLYQMGVVHEAMDQKPEAVAAYLRAFGYRPCRAEPLCALARIHRGASNWPVAYLFASMSAAIHRPADVLFVDQSVYDWRCQDELSIADYYLGRFQESAAACMQILNGHGLPDRERARVQTNLRFALDRMSQPQPCHA